MAAAPRRVVVTGMGLVSPLGCSLDAVWERLCAGQSAVHSTASVSGWEGVPSVHAVATVPRAEGLADLFRSRGIRAPSSASSDFIDFAVLASDLALENAGYPMHPNEKMLDSERSGVAIGMSVMFCLL
jgi:3-oxoacyl-[acyl-carrier-protein] synthase II